MRVLAIFSTSLLAVLLTSPSVHGANECRIRYAYEMGSGAGLKTFTDYKYINLGNAINIDQSRIKWVQNLRDPHVAFEFDDTLGVTDMTLGKDQRNPIGMDFINKPTLVKAICLQPQEETASVSVQAAAQKSIRKLPGRVSRQADRAAAAAFDRGGAMIGATPSIRVVGDGYFRNQQPTNAVGPNNRKPLKWGLNRITINGDHLGGITRITGLHEKASSRIVGRAPTYLHVDIRIPPQVEMHATGTARLVAGRTSTDATFGWTVTGKRRGPAANLYPIGAANGGGSRYVIYSGGSNERTANLSGQNLTFRRINLEGLCEALDPPAPTIYTIQPATPVVPLQKLPDYRWGVGVSNQDVEAHDLDGPIVVELRRGDGTIIDSRRLRSLQLGRRETFTTPRQRAVQLYRIAGDDNCWTLDDPSTADNTTTVNVDTTGVVTESDETDNERAY